MKKFVQTLAAALVLALNLSPPLACAEESGARDGVKAEAGGAKTEEAKASDEVRLAIVNTYGRTLMLSYYSQTIEAIRKEIQPARLSIQWYAPRAFLDAAGRRAFDIAIASSGLSHVMAERNAGAMLLSAVKDDAPDALHANGAAIVVRADRNDLKTVEDLKGKTLAIISKTAFAGWQVPASELIRQGINIEHFFGKVEMTRSPMTNVLEAVRDQRADVGFIATCMLEDLDAVGAIDKNDYRVINARPRSIASSFGCTTSTELYASWTFSVMPSLPAPTAERIVQALLRLQTEGLSSRWTINLGSSSPRKVFEQLHLPLYEGYNLRDFLYEYRRWVIAALSVFALVLANIAFLTVALRIRTRQKEKAIKEKFEAQWKAEQYELKLEALEKSRMIGTLSSLAAHELRQPLAVVNNYAGTLRRQLQKGGLPADMMLKAVSEIEASGLKAADIIDHVRLYARGRRAEHERLDLAEVVKKSVGGRGGSRVGGTARIEINAPCSIFIMGDAMELELMVKNLVKNAAAAVRTVPDPKITVTLTDDGRFAAIAVADNGPAIADEAFARIGKDLYTTRTDGLGLGLQLVRTMAESHGGVLILEKSAGGGLKAVIRLPLDDAHKDMTEDDMADDKVCDVHDIHNRHEKKTENP